MRGDITDHLVHWIKGDSDWESFDVLRSIISEQKIHGGSGHIRDGFKCVCFTEAPEKEFHRVMTRYRPFGVRVSKQWLYALGGRPVIYQSSEEYSLLPEELKWRHVRYDLMSNPSVDFSWEREWRIRTDALNISNDCITLIVPHDKWIFELEEEHRYNEYARMTLERVAYGEWADPQSLSPFGYLCSVVNV